MPVNGFARYIKLAQNVYQPFNYFLFKWSTGRKFLKIITKPNKIRFNVTPEIYLVFKEIFMSDVYDIDTLIPKLSPNPVIIDIGSNVGFFDILVLSKIPTARIEAFEPVPENVAYFKNLIPGNPALTQVKVNEVAVSGKKIPYIELFTEVSQTNRQVVASVIDGFNQNNTKKITVPSISLEEVILGYGDTIIDVLKVDCEGSEYDIFYNSPASLFRKINIMLIEVHNLDNDKNNIHSFAAYIQSLGFHINYTPINGFCYALEATRI